MIVLGAFFFAFSSFPFLFLVSLCQFSHGLIRYCSAFPSSSRANSA